MAGAPTDCAVIVFARAPRAGRVKTRLVPALGADRACRVYGALLGRTLDVVESSGLEPRFLDVAEADDTDWFSARARAGWQLRTQVGADLGERMAHALTTTGSDRALLLGSDLCDVEPSDLALGAAALRNAACCVLGPSHDGGYWLIGLNRPAPALFAAMPWSTARVLGETVERARSLALRVTLLPQRHDLDTVDDLRWLPGELSGLAGIDDAD